VEEGDGLPTFICLSCNHLLDLSYDFKCQIQNSDVKLREILQNKNTKDTALIKDIIDNVISDVAYCKKHNRVAEQEIYSPHEIVTFDSTNAIRSDVTVNGESRITHEFIPKSQEIIDPAEKNARYDTLKDSVHNTEMIEIALCHETHTDNILANQADRLSGSMEEKCIKQDQLILSKNNMTSESLVNESREDTLKIEVKKDESLENFENHDVVKQTAMLGMDNQDAKSGVNCSDDEEKPLINRTIRQKCLHCIKTFATKMALQRHMIVHKHKTKLRYVCYICDKQFSNIAKLKNHVLNSHRSYTTDTKASQEEKQEDKRLSKASTKITRSSSIIDTMKEEKKNFKFACKVCSKQFIYQKSFLSHAKTHSEYNEEILDDVFDQSINKTTNEQKDNKMPTFKENETEEEEEEEDDDDSDLPIESLQCTQCGKLFATKRNLKRHISTHSGLKFNCSTCGKGFSRIDKLKDHEQSKHKEEIFGNTDDEDDDEEDNENKVNENSENRKKVNSIR